MRYSQTIKSVLFSSTVAIVFVSLLVGNDYMVNNIGYPSILEPIGEVIFLISIIFVIPPFFVFRLLYTIGLAWELTGRESFIQSNPGFWLFCVVFYALTFYFFTNYLKKRKKRKA